MYILGVNTGYDRAAFLLKDERILVAIEQERLDRRKHSSSNELPWEAIRYCLDSAGIEEKDLDLVAGSGLWGYDQLPCLLKRFRNSTRVSHHLAHAYSVYFSSGFEEAAVLIADGSGVALKNATEWTGRGSGDLFEAESCYYAQELKYEVIDKRGAPNPKTVMEHIHKGDLQFLDAELSLGNFYSNASSYIFGDWQESGKVMGLAPYGQPDRFSGKELIHKMDGSLTVHGYDFMNSLKSPFHWKDKKCIQEYQDLACKIQSELEEAIVHKLNWLHTQTKTENLCFGGGVALNCITNTRILSDTPFKHLYILPAAGDSGTALGAAYFGYYNLLGGKKRQGLETPFLGRSYAEKEILDSISWYINRHYLHNEVTVSCLEEGELCATAAKLISQGRIVAWFQGGSEIGPRALGHRSILADPRRPDMKDLLNEKVKHRESFRPFAPSVLSEYTQDYFDTGHQSPFMLLVADVREERRGLVPAITHIDGTARLQTVRFEDNPKFHALIHEFYRLTGVPLLLNTSFNIAGEPIVEGPVDAMNSFVKTNMDDLVLENILVSKKMPRKD